MVKLYVVSKVRYMGMDGTDSTPVKVRFCEKSAQAMCEELDKTAEYRHEYDYDHYDVHEVDLPIEEGSDKFKLIALLLGLPDDVKIESYVEYVQWGEIVSRQEPIFDDNIEYSEEDNTLIIGG